MNLHLKLPALFFGLVALVFTLVANAASDSSITGAACIVRSGDNIVLVKEILTDKWSIPAGGVSSGEFPRVAAQRETWEETGLVVTVNKELMRDDYSVFYDCVSDSDIVSFQFNNRLGGFELPIWFAPHYGIEVSSAMLVDISTLPSDEYRFPGQIRWLAQLLPQATDQGVVYVDNLTEAAPLFHQKELGWMAKSQHLLSKLPSGLKGGIEPLILAGNWLATPSLAILIIPLLYWRFGKAFSYKVFFAVTITSLLSLVAQQGFAFPRPHVYLPALEITRSYGFSLPSLPVAVWSCVGVLVLSASDKLFFNRWSMTLGALLMWLSTANFYSGAAFLSDSVSGALLGALCAWHLIRLESNPEVNVAALMTSKPVWFILLAVCAALTLFWPIPVFTYWLAVIMTLLGLIITYRSDDKTASTQAIAVITLLMLVVNGSISVVASLVSTSGIASLGIETIRYPILIALFVLSIRKVAKAG